MVRDQWMRLLFIPLLGVLIPFFSGAITYVHYAGPALLVAQLYFVFVSFCIWQGCHWIHGRLRRLYPVKGDPYPKILSICLLSGLYGASIAGLLFLVWTRLSRETFGAATLLRFVAFSTFAVVIFTLLYEVLYLSKEREIDRNRVDQLDKEKALAELQALRNELDPHFVFNSLTSMSYLIRNDPERAVQFDHKLAQVFRYFLRNKTTDLVPLERELAFIDDYLYLLRIRYEENLQVQVRGRQEAAGYVVPCSLQLLIENAIKHNAFSAAHPLFISIAIDPETACVTNNRRPKESGLPSTKIGLANLDQRYRLVFQQTIAIEKTADEFRVCLPVIPLPATAVLQKEQTSL
ncbi:sensor histidine kinase [Flavisolibacter nicotianae]|uniref:sensor histidine kinase n=1 Tax=Flavisolibacter nicotianae TaxID=2364882 RepID=UPI000EAD1E90|nr:histidine kinase [Flavisolibacter nicotianae]